MKVAELLADPKKWTQYAMARDKDGLEVLVDSDRAICWCLAGAIDKCYPDVKDRDIIRQKIMYYTDQAFLTSWNDSVKHETIMTLCKELDI